MRRCVFTTIQLHLSHTLVECETKFLNAAWQLQATIRCWLWLLGQRKVVTLLSGHPNGDTQLLISEPRLALTLSGARCLTLQIKITFLLDYPVYAINRTMFFMYERFSFENLGSYVKTRLQRLTDIQLVGVICIHSANQCAVAKLCRVNKTNNEFTKVRISLTSNCNTSSMWARVVTCISVSTRKSCATSLKQSVFHFMLHNNVAPNIGQKLSSNQRPIVSGAERVLVVIRLNATFLPLRRYCEKMCTSFLNDAESLTTYGCAPWCSQIAYIRPSSMNTTTAECSDVSEGVCMLQYFRTLPGLDEGSTQCPTLTVVLYQVPRVSEQWRI